MNIACVWEHNGNDSLIYAENLPGAFTRGASKEEALAKMGAEAASYLLWRDGTRPAGSMRTELTQEKASKLHIADADSDVLFSSEKPPLAPEEYEALKALCLKSARDFQRLYDAVPDKDRTALPERQTFYGPAPVTARQMVAHARGVNGYYFGEIGLEAGCEGGIAECRARAFALLERTPDYLENRVFDGSYAEQWTLRKALRRFLWHDRIHAKALCRMARKTFGAGAVPDLFRFGAAL